MCSSSTTDPNRKRSPSSDLSTVRTHCSSCSLLASSSDEYTHTKMVPDKPNLGQPVRVTNLRAVFGMFQKRKCPTAHRVATVAGIARTASVTVSLVTTAGTAHKVSIFLAFLPLQQVFYSWSFRLKLKGAHVTNNHNASTNALFSHESMKCFPRCFRKLFALLFDVFAKQRSRFCFNSISF